MKKELKQPSSYFVLVMFLDFLEEINTGNKMYKAIEYYINKN
jgi:hypothetical protein